MPVQSTVSWALFNPFLLNEVNGNLPARGILREDHPPSHQETGPSRSPAGWWASEHQGGHRTPRAPRAEDPLPGAGMQSTETLWVNLHPVGSKPHRNIWTRRRRGVETASRPGHGLSRASGHEAPVKGSCLQPHMCQLPSRFPSRASD